MNAMAFHEERRRSARRAVNFKVQHRNPRTDKMVFDFARDLSSSGIFLRTHRIRPVGAELELQFPVDDLVSRSRPIKVRGVVTRVTDEGLGVQFDAEDPELAKIIQNLVTR